VKNGVLVVAIMVFCIPLNAVSKEPMGGGLQFHRSVTPDKPVDPATGETGLAKVLKNVKLPSHPSKTFGEAVDSYRYFSKKEWKETHSSNGKVYVDFTGWLKKNSLDFSEVSERGVGIKFLVKPDGNYAVVMVSKLEIKTDGKMFSDPQSDISGILNKLYKNVELKF
jgi:hypothetical protein